jgi:V8-like Glu-specific endopeptidase
MIVFYLLFLLLGFSSAQTPAKVGDLYPIQIRSSGVSDIEGVETPLGQTYTLTHPGATYIALQFSNLALAKDDIIEVSDANGDQAYTLTGSGKGGGSPFWSQHIKGDTIVLNMLTRGKSRRSFFEVNEYAAGFESLFETICGLDDKVNAVCYASSFPTAYDKARAVARLLINGNSLCTGFLVSGSNHLLTNNHCIQNATAALNTDYEFMSEAPLCSSANAQLAYPGTFFDGATFIQTSAALDYTLVQINSGNPSSLYGFLELDSQLTVIGEQIYIPQHAGGKAKQIAIYSTEAVDATDGFCQINNVGNTGCGGNLGSTNVFYLCDTEGGSSGSPVISMVTNKVVGLHKCGGCSNGNDGTSAHLVWNQVASILSPVAPVPVPVPAPSPVPVPVPAPLPVPVPVPVPIPVPVPAPVPAPVPSCLPRDGRCTSGSECCSGVCKRNGRCN